MSKQQPLHMWPYWRDKYGPLDALRDYYPHLLACDRMLNAAAAQIEMAEVAIETRMADRMASELDPER